MKTNQELEARATPAITETQGQVSEKPELDSRDVANCFSLFLGRTPAPSSTTAGQSGSLPALLCMLFETDEFKNGVLPPLLLREALPHCLMDDKPPFPLIDWVQRRLPIAPSTRRAVGGARTWAQLLELLLSDANLVAVSPALAAAGIDRILLARLENEPLSKVKRSVIGAVDAVSAFELRGWAVDLCDKSVPVILEFYADNTLIGAVPCNQSRPDVGDLIGGDGQVGFSFKISTAHRAGFAGGRTLAAIDALSRQQIGSSVVVHADAAQNWDAIGATRAELAQLRTILDRIEARLPEVARMASVPIEAYNEYWERFYRPSPEMLSGQRIASAQFTHRPLVSVIVPTWNGNIRLLGKAIDSVCAQTYDRWELVIVDDASGSDELRVLQRRYVSEPRIRWVEATTREGIAGASNRGVAAATGDYIAFLDHDDQLACDALYYIVLLIQEHPFRLLYSDEDRIEEDEFGRCVHHTPFFKPGFDPDLLLALNYMCHLVVLRRDVFDAIGGLRGGIEGAQDHDFLLRASGHLPASDIRHVPRVLYHWRVTEGSVSQNPARVQEIQAKIVASVDAHLKQQKLLAKVEAHCDPIGVSRQFATRVRWSLPPVPPKISIIVATRDRVDLLRACLTSVLDTIEAYPGEHEILVMDNDSVEPATLSYLTSLSLRPQIRLLHFRGAFNYSAINNCAARQASGEVLIFLNNDTVVCTRDWCVELVANALRSEVGAVGARLLYADGTIQHAGVLLGVEGVGGHECVGESPRTGGYFGRSHLLRSASAVTAACLATRRDLFMALEGFDELGLKIAFNDVDYCMRVRKAGYRIVYNPYAVLYHFESKSRGREFSEAQRKRLRQEASCFRGRWSDAEIVDPYYNLHFERFARPFDRLRCPPAIEDRFAGVPLNGVASFET